MAADVINYVMIGYVLDYHKEDISELIFKTEENSVDDFDDFADKWMNNPLEGRIKLIDGDWFNDKLMRFGYILSMDSIFDDKEDKIKIISLNSLHHTEKIVKESFKEFLKDLKNNDPNIEKLEPKLVIFQYQY